MKKYLTNLYCFYEEGYLLIFLLHSCVVTEMNYLEFIVLCNSLVLSKIVVKFVNAL